MLNVERQAGGNQERSGPCSVILSILVSALLAATLAACGYQFRVDGAGPTIGGTPTATSAEPPPRLAIKTLINNSFEPNLEVRYTNYLRDEFSTGSGAHVVSESDMADLVLSGQILSVTVPTLSFSQAATLESRAEVVVLVRVEEIRSGKVVWTQLAKGGAEFFITQDLQFNRTLQNRAVEQAGRILAADLASRFLLEVETGGLTKRTSAKEAPQR